MGYKSLRWRSLLMPFDLRFPTGETYLYSRAALFSGLAAAHQTETRKDR